MPDTTDGRVGELPRISTGISGLDNILHGGLPKDRIYLVEGDPGTGKTTLAMQFVLSGIRKGGRALYISLSETEQELRAMGESHGWELDGLDIFELIPVEANLSGENQYSFFHPEEIELGETIRTIVVVSARQIQHTSSLTPYRSCGCSHSIRAAIAVRCSR